MVAFKNSTGKPHPLSRGIKTLNKRATGSIPLTNVESEFWYGTISIGTPAKTFTGMTV